MSRLHILQTVVLGLYGLLCLADCSIGADAPVGSIDTPEAAKPASLVRDVVAIFRRSCFECHGENEQQAGLRLDQREEVLNSGLISPGVPDQSELLRRITLSRDEAGVMPAVGKPLPPDDVAVIRRWLAEGARWPERLELEAHWAYVPPRQPQPPPVRRESWVRNPIDRFVLRKLQAEGLQPKPQAAPTKLVRRLYLDLIGLPPSPGEIDAFVQDSSEAKLERLVDDLISRPQFGERWARPWLDLARYADSHGFQRDNLREIWAYRDWVIRAINSDMPFDRFTIEQVAGDLLPDATEDQRIATGFHRCTPTNVEAGSLPEETRVEQLIDRVNTTGAVWLGTTMECCQCHDHKYDPFSMQDYYRLLAYFNSTEREADRVNPKRPSSIKFQGPSMPLGDPVRDAQRVEVKRQLNSKQQELAELRQSLEADLPAVVEDIRKRLSRTSVQPLEVTSFRSQGTMDKHEILEDDSVLLLGDNPPATDLYHVRLKTTLPEITAIRLDVLQHQQLPGSGPGRGDPKRSNFVLNELAAWSIARSGEEERRNRLSFATASASFSQNGFAVSRAIDGKANTGWAIAPELKQDHWATLLLEEPIQAKAGVELELSLSQQWGRARTIGRFRVSAVTGDPDLLAVSDAIKQVLGEPLKAWSPKDRERVVDYLLEEQPEARRLREQLTVLENRLNDLAPDTTLVMVELEQPRPTRVFGRGDYRLPGERVEPGTPAVFAALDDAEPNRLGLAKWLVSRRNPLTARVTVNRYWAQLFGKGIVTTPEDFGVKGDAPTHPDLLDWLAVEFMEKGWSVKHLLRTIVLSATYQQSSEATFEDLRHDDPNELLGRGPNFRMSAEMVRDNALAISGLIDLKLFGPPVRPYQPAGIWSKVGGTAYDYEVSPGGDQHRRGIYVVLKRGSPYPSFMNFDATARLTCTVKRSRTNTPLQALTLLNDPVYVEAARALGERIVREKPDASVEARLRYGFQLCTGREPADQELQLLHRLYRSQLKPERANGPDSGDEKRDAAWESIATVLLNLHETITKD